MEQKHPALGIDFGTSRIGIAATDDFGIMAHPVETIDATKKPLDRIAEIIAQRKIKVIVLGLPKRIDGSDSESTKKVRTFAEQIKKQVPHLPLMFQDESFTTMTAAEKLRDAGKKAKQQKNIIDQAAAVEILNQWMEQ